MRGFFAAALWSALGIAVLLAVVPAASAEKYVAMGDSYSSGTGSREYDLDAACERSSKAFAPQIKGDLGAADSFRFVACSGAKIPEVLTNAQGANPVQVSVLGNDTRDVTISIGGNDAGFSGTLVQCGLPLVSCDGDIDSSQNYIRNTLPGRLDQVLTRIRTNAPNARIGLVGYPRLFPANGNDCSALTFFSAGEIARLNQTADLLADVARDRARAHGAAFIDARPAFLGHAWCEDEWINGLSNPTSNSFHPNQSGYVGYAGITRAAMLATPDRGQTRAPDGRIAFTTDRDGNREIYTVNPDGSFPVNLTGNAADDRDPVFSPDGSRVAFASDRSGRFQIYTIDAAGGPATRLTSSAGDNVEPEFSPNGKQIVFTSSRDGNNEIYKMNADGSGQTRLTANAASDFAPTFSPDGAEIAFQRYTPGSGKGQGNEVFRMSSDGQGQINLTDNAAAVCDGAPAFSPDGTRIAFHSNREGAFRIYTIPVTGGTAVRIGSPGSGNDRNPAWAPGGDRIAFESDRSGSSRVHTMAADGSGRAERTAGPGADTMPAWQSDSRPPETTITTAPPELSNNPAPTFGFEADEPGSTFECRLDDGPFTGCSSPWASPSLADGSHTFRVRARDPFGNVDPDPAVHTFTIDTAGKFSRITAGPDGPTASPEPVFEFESDDPDTELTFECRLGPADGPAPGWGDCSSPFAPGQLADGAYRFEVRGTDRAGNVEPDPQVRNFTVDTRRPVSEVTQAPPAFGADRNPVIAFTADEPGVRFECRIFPDQPGSEPAAWESCVSPRRAGPLADGAWRFELRATDPAGNVETDPITVTFTVDTRAPVTTLDEAPGEAEPTGDVSFSFSTDEPDVRHECRLDPATGTEWTSCESPVERTGLGHGRHEFEVRAIDRAGNVEDPPVSHPFGVKTDPDLRIVTAPSGVTGNRRPTVTFTAADPDMQFECRFGPAGENGEWQPCDSPWRPVAGESGEPVDLTDGEYRFQLRGTDWFNLDLPESERQKITLPAREWTVASGPPEAMIISGPAALDNSREAVFELDAGLAADILECRLDGGPWRPCEPGAGGTRRQEARFPGLFDGEHELRVRSRGPLGDGPVAVHRWTLDATPPEVRITRAPARRTASPSAAWEFTGLGGHTGFLCRLDQADLEPCESPLELRGLPDGEHRFEVVAVDEAGNRSPAATRSWEVDTTGPEVRLTGVPNPVTAARTAAFSFEADDPAAVFTCRLDGGPWTSCSSPAARRVGLGSHRFEVKAADDLGNEGEAATATWRVVAPRVNLKPRARLNRRGRAQIGRIVCRGDLPCRIKLPGRVILRKGKVRVPARVAGPKRVAPGAAVNLRLVAGKAALRRLRKRPVQTRIRVSLRPAGEPAVTVARRITVRI